MQKVGLEALISFGLLFLALGAVVEGFGEVVRGLAPVQGALWRLIGLGLVLGWWSASRQRGLFFLFLCTVFGGPAIFLWFGSLLQEGWYLLRALLAWLVNWENFWAVGAPTFAPPGSEALQLAGIRFAVQAVDYAAELHSWLGGWFLAEPKFSLKAVAYFLGVISWSLAVLAGWTGQKNSRIECSLVPAGILLLAVQAFGQQDSHLELILFAAPVLFLFALRTWRSNQYRWEHTRLDYAEYLRLDFAVAASVWVLALSLLAYVVPFARDWFSSNAWYLQPQKDVPAAGPSGESLPVGDLLGLMTPTPTPGYLSTYQSPGMPRSHLLGAGPELREQVVMFVRLENHPDPAGERFNWRGLVYENYTGSGWSVGSLELQIFPAGAEIPLDWMDQGRLLRQTVQVVGSPGQLAFAAGDILTMDHPFEVSWSAGRDEPGFIFGIRQRAGTYRVDSILPAYTQEILRSAGSVYPSSISDRFLPLPDSLPGRVMDLAVQVASGQTNPFDQARAIENFLRRFPYTLELPAPPAGRDAVDYFLFDLQRGYCDYYASAMVVMARSIGIPARLAVGFNAGIYDAANQRFIVTAQQAHSWPEIYFPQVGWVAFEPTAGLAPITWDKAPSEIGAVERMVENPPVAKWLAALPDIAWPWLAAGVGILLALAVWIDRLVLRSYPPDRFFALVMRRLYRFRRTRLDPGPGQITPYELVHAMEVALAPFSRRTGFLPTLLDCRGEINRLAKYHVLSSYAQTGPGKDEQETGLQLWLKMRYKLLLIRIWLIFQRRILRRKS